jgi:hypothetical protein
MNLEYYNRRINETVAETLGYRRWRFGDRWVKGLCLLDARFNNYIRRVVEDAPANAEYVKLNIEEVGIRKVEEIKEHFTPASHWVSPYGKISAKPPNFTKNLNAMAVAESVLNADEMQEYDSQLPLQGNNKCANTALARAICWLRVKKIQY